MTFSYPPRTTGARGFGDFGLRGCAFDAYGVVPYAQKSETAGLGGELGPGAERLPGGGVERGQRLTEEDHAETGDGCNQRQQQRRLGRQAASSLWAKRFKKVRIFI